jgi:glycosyltransferase involved in cell wall biosynthesis
MEQGVGQDEKEMVMHFTVIIVHYNTPRLLERALKSIPRNIPILVVENGDSHRLLLKKEDRVVFPPTKMFHGDGLHFGIQYIDTPYFVTMDSDAYIKDRKIFDIMLRSFDPNTYGVGYVTKVDKNGLDDWHQSSNSPYFPYLHPFFSMIHTEKYHKCKPFVHHGAPAIRAMQSLKNYTLTNLGLMQKYVKHDGRGTRNITTEYMKGWE